MWKEFLSSPDTAKWIGLTIAAFVLALSTLVLARFRFIQSRPWSACVVLSVIAHVLLFFAAYFVRFFDAPDFSSGGTITMRLVAEDAPAPVEETDETDPATDSSAVQPAEVAERPTEISEPDWPPLVADSPDVIEEPEVVAEVIPEPVASVADNSWHSPAAPVSDDFTDLPQDSLDQLDVPAPPAEMRSDPPNIMQPPESMTESDVVSESQPWIPIATADGLSESVSEERPALMEPVDGSPDSLTVNPRMSHRLTSQRWQLLKKHGGNADTEKAVQDALRWLTNHQHADGGWHAGEHGAGTAHIIEYQDRRGTGLRADTGVTGLALLALLGAGETTQHGKYQQHVRRGLQYLCKAQADDGNLAGRANHFAGMYCHGIASLALSEAFAMTQEAQWARPLQRAVNYSRACQHHVTGGWRYRPGDAGDTSQFGWQVMALVSGQQAGISLPPQVAGGIERYLRSVSSGRDGGLASYRNFLPPTPPMTAEALVCRLMLAKQSPLTVHEATEFVLSHPPGSDPLNLYYCYYGSLALHLADASWQSWNAQMQSAILRSQVRRGADAGSWRLDTIWGRCGGRVYTTATAALALEVYYRYLPIVDRTLARR